MVNKATNIEGDTPENSKCLICHCLVYEPMICEKACSSTFCRDCIEGWLNKGNYKCPMCECDNYDPKPLPPFGLKYLNEEKVVCWND